MFGNTCMTRLTKDDFDAFAANVREEWELDHPGMECPHNLAVPSMRDLESIDEDDMLFELRVVRHLPVFA